MSAIYMWMDGIYCLLVCKPAALGNLVNILRWSYFKALTEVDGYSGFMNKLGHGGGRHDGLLVQSLKPVMEISSNTAFIARITYVSKKSNFMENWMKYSTRKNPARVIFFFLNPVFEEVSSPRHRDELV